MKVMWSGFSPSLKISYYRYGLALPVMLWDAKMPTWWDAARWCCKSALWRSARWDTPALPMACQKEDASGLQLTTGNWSFRKQNPRWCGGLLYAFPLWGAFGLCLVSIFPPRPHGKLLLWQPHLYLDLLWVNTNQTHGPNDPWVPGLLLLNLNGLTICEALGK